ncbi:Helix-turn-helix [Pseudidiomarina planktonica]|uniref:Helix-turn-helix n=1 Tax=Pseudidiomarina planktonica TaxID=1323738 RepID=A0A1Y6EWZ6_9GAMM|nr:helix-turn-helix domain-containing protein [Pseudidiomarina planktonica]RUO65424.1 helix-turn-helix domain-containing protein [Pseudidiomarina planktonica]SMQ65062.1 Helix-turn-helix [Pseudidiomarina planktonica]
MEINAEIIKKYRQKRCWSQLQLAEMAGISMRTLQRVEAQSTASLETIKSIASVLEISSEDLLQQENTSNLDAAKVDSTYQRKRTQLIVGVVLVCIVNVIALALLFYQREQQAIDESTFFILKNLVSVTLVLSVGVALFQGYRKGLIFKKDIY